MRSILWVFLACALVIGFPTAMAAGAHPHAAGSHEGAHGGHAHTHTFRHHHHSGDLGTLALLALGGRDLWWSGAYYGYPFGFGYGTYGYPLYSYPLATTYVINAPSAANATANNTTVTAVVAPPCDAYRLASDWVGWQVCMSQRAYWSGP